ncbi:MAG: S8 family peptidase [Roseburia sp.]|nr:S8 family peptidase [Roseburia sp.]MCM1277756.1 S8 family peptidase [Robinsoniella sp.]
MNNILQLKGQFQKRKAPGGFGPTNLPKGKKVNAGHVLKLQQQLQDIISFWNEEKMIGGALVSVHYRCVVAKSNRIQLLLSDRGRHPNQAIRGSRFSDGYNENKEWVKKHVFTYFLSIESLHKSEKLLDKCAAIIQKFYNGEISSDDTESINSGIYNDSIMAKSTFLRTLVDCSYVEDFCIDRTSQAASEQSIVTIYKTGVETTELLGKLGINMIHAKMIDETTLRMEKEEIDILCDKAPYLIAMSVKDFAEIAYKISDSKSYKEQISIPEPGNQPTIGVIDTQFDKRVYFGDWVDYKKCISDDIEISAEDYFHGTAVSSIIVDGPAFNPQLEDDCGRFRVRHFGVATAGRFSSFAILKQIRNIVRENRDIKVWNLSLGSAMEINPNFISPEAAELDRIQYEYDVIFVVAGTNKKRNSDINKIGAPADSLNSLVVNAVDFDGKPASYTRRGPVLSFFYKPDVCYYGGDDSEKIVVCEPLGKATVSGTSFAAPWITRKIAYLIHVMGLSRELAKALIIDSAAGWDRQDTIKYEKGYGIVPKKIRDILYSKDDEIRFIMSGSIDEYETYTYNIPVPQDMNAHPFFAKATLAYFPKSDRNQGVDYTSTEMDIHFGRIMEQKGKATIKAIDYNRQAEEGLQNIYEEDARKLYRKWDNIKHISEALKENGRPRKAYQSGMWGLSIKTKERLDSKAGRGLQFGVVVTLKEMNGVNRIDDFIKMCMLKGWLVTRLDVNTQVDVYVKAEEEITFE